MQKIDVPSVHVLHFSGSSVLRYFYGIVTFIILKMTHRLKKFTMGNISWRYSFTVSQVQKLALKLTCTLTNKLQYCAICITYILGSEKKTLPATVAVYEVNPKYDLDVVLLKEWKGI